jgi:hypothetical protein
VTALVVAGFALLLLLLLPILRLIRHRASPRAGHRVERKGQFRRHKARVSQQRAT